ncbi:PIG-L family deacetylase [Pontibacter virosus]|uniref:LmbE family N-acetylglucosaminyl deacetylase n=1 Tax=Pontibacter virosus TaxID=1765052 RepID=A0A2U1B311_9BACT|nr:PIG-L family deacetylase [Pontibacter virosus]PVY43074.1 LmbE family N-acetylglucosaminyl deacetylase [Pontibacter virosus]
MKKSFSLLFTFFLLLTCGPLQAQAPAKPDAAALLQDIKKLNVLGTALYVAAHPDDENTRFIAYLSNEKLYNTGYLSVTRGDGGQNLIGPEIREGLGIIRTQELLQARRIDGGQQFFTRANDFGYSKNPEETFATWDKEKVLHDVVWAIRKFKPDVIITRFSPKPSETHGHHTASAMLANEAFEAAADPKRFPEQLKYVQVWQAKRVLWNTGVWSFRSQKEFEDYGSQLLKVDVGGYNPLLGKSYPEIAALSRSMHKSQGFGATGTRGVTIEYLDHTKGERAKEELFEGINTTWSRVKGSDKVAALLQQAVSEFKPEQPAAVVPTLLAARKELAKLPDSYWKRLKAEELEQVVKHSLGLYLEAVATDYAVTPGERLNLQIETINRSAIPVQLVGMRPAFASKDSILNKTLAPNESHLIPFKLPIPASAQLSQPYWLRQEGTLGLFRVDDLQEIGAPENQPAAEVHFDLLISGEPFRYTVPVVYKRNDPVDGEQYRPLAITPPVFVNILEKVLMFASQEPKPVHVLVKAGKAGIKGNVALQLPKGWRAEPAQVAFDLEQNGAEQLVRFMVHPPKGQQEVALKAVATVAGKPYTRGLNLIQYSHIPTQTTFPEAVAKAVRLDLKRNGEQIAYLMGAGDDIPASLQQIGYNVTLLKDEDITDQNLKRFDAVILGVRAYNTVERMNFYQPRLLNYVQQGGTVIVQYNTGHSLKTSNVAPYPLKISSQRVTVEDADVRFLKPGHQALNSPNKITKKDFEGWVQERGLYFPSEWSSEFEAILSSNDPGEPARDGGLLIARHGKGHFVYTGYSWFRQLPAGVPGAYRIFTNLISLGNGHGAQGSSAESTAK